MSVAAAARRRALLRRLSGRPRVGVGSLVSLISICASLLQLWESPPRTILHAFVGRVPELASDLWWCSALKSDAVVRGFRVRRKLWPARRVTESTQPRTNRGLAVTLPILGLNQFSTDAVVAFACLCRRGGCHSVSVDHPPRQSPVKTLELALTRLEGFLTSALEHHWPDVILACDSAKPDTTTAPNTTRCRQRLRSVPHQHGEWTPRPARFTGHATM